MRDMKDIVKIFVIFVLIAVLLLQAGTTRTPARHAPNLYVGPIFDPTFIGVIDAISHIEPSQDLYLHYRSFRE